MSEGQPSNQSKTHVEVFDRGVVVPGVGDCGIDAPILRMEYCWLEYGRIVSTRITI